MLMALCPGGGQPQVVSPQGSVLGTGLFKIFINAIGRVSKCTFSKFADDTKLNGAVDRTERRDANQKEPNRLETGCG